MTGNGNALFHALGLHMHQPPDNLRLLIDSDAWVAEEIIRRAAKAPPSGSSAPE